MDWSISFNLRFEYMLHLYKKQCSISNLTNPSQNYYQKTASSIDHIIHYLILKIFTYTPFFNVILIRNQTMCKVKQITRLRNSLSMSSDREVFINSFFVEITCTISCYLPVFAILLCKDCSIRSLSTSPFFHRGLSTGAGFFSLTTFDRLKLLSYNPFSN